MFDLSFKDKGIINFEKPYFYAFLVNPNKKIKAVFPPKSDYNINGNTKWERWRTESRQDEFYTDSLHLMEESGEYYIPRGTLIEGSGEYVYVEEGTLYRPHRSREIKYTFKFDETSATGIWKIYVFLFDETYKNRNGEEVDSADAIVYRKQPFRVTSKSRPSPLPTISRNTTYAFWTSLGFFISLFGVGSRYPYKIKGFLNRTKREIKENKYFLIGVIILFLFFLFFAFY